jgi:hypothetical protein
MRILNWLFLLLSFAIAIGLLLYSDFLFLVYIGTLPPTFLLAWFVRRLSRPKPVFENSGDTQDHQIMPDWKRKLGRTLWLAAAIALIWSVLLVLLVFEMELGIDLSYPAPRISYASQDAFQILYDAKIDIGDGNTFRLKEHYEISPKAHYTIIDIQEIESGEIPKTNIDKHEKFHTGSFENVPLEGVRAHFYRNLTLSRDRQGLLMSKMTLPLPGIRLLVKDVSISDSSADMNSVGESLETFYITEYSNVKSRIEMEMPKNAFISSLPKGEINSVPDKDVVTFLDFPVEIQVYSLQYLRLKVVRDVFSESSNNYDALYRLLAFLFWPTSMIIVGVFHQKLANRILDIVSRPFQKKRKRPIGFNP